MKRKTYNKIKHYDCYNNSCIMCKYSRDCYKLNENGIWNPVESFMSDMFPWLSLSLRDKIKLWRMK